MSFFDKLTVENGLNSLEASWLDFELDSAHMGLTCDSPSGRRAGRGATAAHEEASSSRVVRSSVGMIHASTGADRSSWAPHVAWLSWRRAEAAVKRSKWR